MSEAIIDLDPHLAAKKEAQKEVRFVLRVLNGQQQGAEIALPSGLYRIGTEEDNDIVLIGEGIAEHHGEMFFDEKNDGQATLMELQEEIYINNEAVQQEALPLELPLQETIQLGQVAISINARSDNWPQQNEIEQEVVETLALIKANTPLTLWHQTQRHFQDKQKSALTFLGLGFVASIFIVMLAFSSHSTQNPKTIADSAAERLVQHLASNPAYQHIKLLHAEPKKQLIGYVERTEDLNRLRSMAANSFVDSNVVSMERIDKSLNVIAQSYSGHLSYKLIPQDNRKIHLLLYGTIGESHQREVLRAILKRDLPSITSIEIDVITQTEALEVLQGWLSSYPLFAGLRAEENKDGLFIKGNLLGDAKADWQRALLETPPNLPKNMLPFIDIYFSPPLPGKIVSFITGEKAQLRIFYKNKTHLASVGSKLRGGFVIKNIQRDKITLTFRKRDFIYPLGD